MQLHVFSACSLVAAPDLAPWTLSTSPAFLASSGANLSSGTGAEIEPCFATKISVLKLFFSCSRFPLLRHLAPVWSGYSLGKFLKKVFDKIGVGKEVSFPAHQVLKQAHKELRAIVGLHENEAERNSSKEANVSLGNGNKNNKSVTEFTRIEDTRNEDDDDENGDPHQKKRTKDFIDIYLEKLAEFKQEGHSLLTDHGELSSG